jgi:hypothetical protein
MNSLCVCEWVCVSEWVCVCVCVSECVCEWVCLSDTLLYSQRKQFHLSMGPLQMSADRWHEMEGHGRDFRNLSPATGSWHIQRLEIVYRNVLIMKLCWKILVLLHSPPFCSKVYLFPSSNFQTHKLLNLFKWHLQIHFPVKRTPLLNHKDKTLSAVYESVPFLLK